MSQKSKQSTSTRPEDEEPRLGSDPNLEYCRGLAEEVFRGRKGAVTIGTTPYTCSCDLLRDLIENARLQWHCAAECGYSPSKWLLEQEMKARGCWPDKKFEDIYDVADQQSLVGLGLSGGGIRSATFNLGVLQAFAELGMLEHIDYLSSVSGGGYIHQFLAAWILRDPHGRAGVEAKLISQPEPGCLPRRPEPIRWLQRYASYLTPRRGLLGADTWTMIAIWFRNTILNQIPILAVIFTAFFLLHLLVQESMQSHADLTHALEHFGEWSVFWLGFALLLAVGWSILALARDLHRQESIAHGGTVQTNIAAERLLDNMKVRWFIILPWLMLAVWCTYLPQLRFVHETPLWYSAAPWIGCVAILVATLCVAFAGGAGSAYQALHEGAPWLKRCAAVALLSLFPLLAAVVACIFAYVFQKGIAELAAWISSQLPLAPVAAGDAILQVFRRPAHPAAGSTIDPWRIQVVILPALLLSVPYIAFELTLGLLGRDYADSRREWLARLRAWSLLYGLLWMGITAIALVGPYCVYFLWSQGTAGKLSAIGAFVLSHLAALLAGSSSKSDGKRSNSSGIFGYKPMDLLALVAAPIAVVCLLVLISFCVEWGVSYLLQPGRLQELCTLVVTHIHLLQWLPAAKVIAHPGWKPVLLISAAIFLAIAMLFGVRVDINEFSMQSFYRNRLSRCYLGASIRDRSPNPFTGFDMRNSLNVENERGRRTPPLVKDLLPNKFSTPDSRPPGTYDGPFPIFCSTLNLTTGEDLGTQERKGASFAFTPLYSGYSVGWTDAGKRGNEAVSLNGYVPTAQYAYPKGGIHIDTAVAVSGAAVNPNQGYNSNPLLAFWMTFFNVRLGWWISNPRHTKTWRAGGVSADTAAAPATPPDGTIPAQHTGALNRPTPSVALYYLLRELLGSANDKSPYVNLSDGGHFDNMGLYELARRRCKYIVICDAEQDTQMTFAGIGNAINRCRADFGVEIDLDLRPLQLQENGFSKAHCVVGTVRYPAPGETPTEAAGGVDSTCNGQRNPEAGRDGYTGTILYMKSSLVGDEPADLMAYKFQHPQFPQDSTANQWFTETQFESYRRLGQHVAVTAIRPALSPGHAKVSDIHELFASMYAIWYPPTPEMQQHFSEHVAQYESILRELRERPELAGLAERLNQSGETGPASWTPPGTPATSPDYSWQFANSLLDFMYTVYTNLQLAFPDNRTSPHAQWWICLFRRWCKVSLMQDTWRVLAPVYSREFRLFAERELQLPRTNGTMPPATNGKPPSEDKLQPIGD